MPQVATVSRPKGIHATNATLPNATLPNDTTPQTSVPSIQRALRSVAPVRLVLKRTLDVATALMLPGQQLTNTDRCALMTILFSAEH